MLTSPRSACGMSRLPWLLSSGASSIAERMGSSAREPWATNKDDLMTRPSRTVIRAGHVIAFDGHGHRHLRDGVVVVEGKSILHVGRSYDGSADTVIDAPDDVLTPGLISTHAHIAGSPLDRSFIEDRGNPQFYMSGLFEMLPVRGAAQDREGDRACVDFSMPEMLRSGCTTVMEMGGAGEYVAERAGVYGMRCYVAQGYRSGRWVTYDGKR